MRSCDFNPYVELMYGEYKDWAFSEEATNFKGFWRSEIFQVPEETPVDLEIGTGNGYHFADYVKRHQDRRVIGMELKYKPLIQTIRRALREGSENARMLRLDAGRVSELFREQEVNNVFIHHPDPWPKKRHNKNRLIQPQFLTNLYSVMKPGSFLEFKTDHYGYFQWAIKCFQDSAFELQFFTEDLHNSFRSDENFVTQFEKIFIQKKQPIFYARLRKTQ